MTTEKTLTAAEIADYIHRSKQAIYWYRKHKKFPKPIPGTSPFEWREADINKWLSRQNLRKDYNRVEHVERTSVKRVRFTEPDDHPMTINTSTHATPKQVWYVAGAEPFGIMPNLFPTKEEAERYARYVFPDEPIDTRYARIYYKEVERWTPV